MQLDNSNNNISNNNLLSVPFSFAHSCIRNLELANAVRAKWLGPGGKRKKKLKSEELEHTRKQEHKQTLTNNK